MDAFYVSVEIRDNPRLEGKPVAVGGKSSSRGVLSTCNYIARQYGVRSAMPTAVALKKCPHLVVVPGRMEVYRETSQVIREIFRKYTDIIEPLSLDEAYLDLTDCQRRAGSATLIARDIREEIFKDTKLTASAGIAPLKFLAKVASDLNKPNGQYTISPDEVHDFLSTLQLKKISGVGKVTYEKLSKLGLETCGDIRNSSEAFLVQSLGKFGQTLWNRSHGIDEREVKIDRERKSTGVEKTFAQDKTDLNELFAILRDVLIPELKRRASRHLETRGIKKVGIKVKFSDFTQTTKESSSREIDFQVFKCMLIEALERGKGKSVRLLGVQIGLQDNSVVGKQLSLDF